MIELRGIRSLLDVVSFQLDQYTEHWRAWAGAYIAANGLDDPKDEHAFSDLAEWIGDMRRMCGHLGLGSDRMIERIAAKFTGEEKVSGPVACALVDELIESLRDSVENRKCYLMGPEECRLLEWKAAPEIMYAFPAAVADLEEAAACLAFGRYKATEFHSMNALESPLRAMAKYFSVRFDPSSSTWGAVIGNLRDRIDSIGRTAKRGRRKSDTLQFYGEAAKEFSYFMEAWRNHVMHGRGTYDQHTARSVWEHVVTFTEHLSKRLKSNGKARCGL
jgi:hypothetical protein